MERDAADLSVEDFFDWLENSTTEEERSAGMHELYRRFSDMRVNYLQLRIGGSGKGGEEGVTEGLVKRLAARGNGRGGSEETGKDNGALSKYSRDRIDATRKTGRISMKAMTTIHGQKTSQYGDTANARNDEEVHDHTENNECVICLDRVCSGLYSSFKTTRD